MLKAEIIRHTLNFAFVAHTSRETFTQKPTYFIHVFDDTMPQVRGIGEVAVFPSLQPSFKSVDCFERQLYEVADNIDHYANGRELPQNSAIRFGIESAMNDFAHGGRGMLYGQQALDNIRDGIRINGLVWMNDIDTMQRQIADKIEQGFGCLKLKIGALDFDKELNLIAQVRRCFPKSVLQIRVDANGAFSAKDAPAKLEALSRYDLHSIEQPLRRDDPAMSRLCRTSPLPIALDEDMIERWWPANRMTEWLADLSPAYIVLKPSLTGGFEYADRWVEVANTLGINWWATSALESNIGLSAIAQWLGTHPDNLDIPHGLGTGQIYTNNVDAPVQLRGERMFVTL